MTQATIKEIDALEVIDRSKQPKAGTAKNIQFPEFFETKTENGITILVIEDKRLPLVTTRFVFRSGSSNDYFAGEKKSGLASFATELLTKGTALRDAERIAEDIDFMGATLLTGCDLDSTHISSFGLKKYFDNIFDIISEIILEPRFSEDEINRLRAQRINSLLSMMDDGDYLADKVFKKNVYCNTPYSIPVEGTLQTIKSLERKDIVASYENSFYPENLIAAFVGDITPDEVLKKMNAVFSNWKMKKKNETSFVFPEKDKATKIYLTQKNGAVQSSIKMGHRGIERSNSDYISVYVMNMLLGGYFTSRINKNLREKNGFTYASRSLFNANRFAGDFAVSTEVKNDITSDAVKEILYEVREMQNNLVADEELQNIKNYISGSFPMRLETPNAIASRVMNLKLYDLDREYYNTYLKKVNAITRQDIQQAAEKYLFPDNLVISIAGDTKEIIQNVSQFGDVETSESIFD